MSSAAVVTSALTINTENLGPVVQRVVSLTSLLRVISSHFFTVLADSMYNILIFFAEKI